VPTVPKYNDNNTEVTPSLDSGITGARATAQTFGAGVGDAMAGFGRGVDQLSDTISKNALRLQDDLNSAHETELFIHAIEQSGQYKNKLNSLEGKAALDYYNNGYITDLKKVIDETGANANPAVRKKFEQDFKRRLSYDIVNGASYAATQMKKYTNDASNARIELAKRSAAEAHEDDKQFQSLVDDTIGTVKQQGMSNGWGEESTKLEVEKKRSELWNSRISAMAEKDPFRAKSLYETNKDQITGTEQYKTEHTIRQNLVRVGSKIKADEALAGFEPGTISEDLVKEVKVLEGFREKPYWDFKQHTVGYGTRARSPDEKVTEEEADKRLRDELGRSANVVDQLNPNLPAGTRNALISLTFNAGSGWTQSGLGRKIQEGDIEGAKENFVQYNKAGGEVNPGLVSRRAKEASWWGGDSQELGSINANSTESRVTRAVRQGKDVAKEIFPNDPGSQADFADAYEKRIRGEFNNMRRQVKDNERELKYTVQQELIGTEKRPTKLEELSPAAQQAYGNMDGLAQSKVREQLLKNSKTDVPMTVGRLQLSQQLKGLAATDPQAFADLDVSTVDLPQRQKNELLQQQIKVKQTGQQEVKLNQYLGSVRDLLRTAGVTQEKDNEEKNKKYNQFVGASIDALKEFELDKKHFPTEAERREIAANLLRVTQESSWLNWTSEKRAFEDKGAPVKVNTPDEARALKAGTRFVTPDGRTGTR
jgi:GH24 family phage-related lysozyme (muramidase)